jgi:hypothetical protein
MDEYYTRSGRKHTREELEKMPIKKLGRILSLFRGDMYLEIYQIYLDKKDKKTKISPIPNDRLLLKKFRDVILTELAMIGGRNLRAEACKKIYKEILFKTDEINKILQDLEQEDHADLVEFKKTFKR